MRLDEAMAVYDRYPMLKSDGVIYGSVAEVIQQLEQQRDRAAAELAALPRPTIVCLCGSTRFYDAFQRAYYEETMAGRIVLSVGFVPDSAEHGEHIGITTEQKEALDVLHLEKVKMADEVLVLNQDDYVGTSTDRELAYARALHKRIRWLVKPSRHALDSEI